MGKIHCAVCDKESKSLCIGCYAISYCSKECQKAHWKVHKKECKGKSDLSQGASERAFAKGYAKQTLKGSRGGDPIVYDLRVGDSSAIPAKESKLDMKKLGAISALDKELEDAPTAGMDFYRELFAFLQTTMGSKLESVRKNLVIEAKKSGGIAILPILFYTIHLPKCRLLCGPYVTGVLVVTSKSRGALYATFSTDIGGIYTFTLSEDGTKNIHVCRDTIFSGKHRSGSEMIPVTDAARIYHVINPETGNIIGVVGLPRSTYPVSVKSLTHVCCGPHEARIVSCYCMKHLYCSRKCAEKYDDHTETECKEEAKKVNPKMLH